MHNMSNPCSEDAYRPAFEAALELLTRKNPRFGHNRLTGEDVLSSLLTLPERERFSVVASGELPLMPDLVSLLLMRCRRALGRFPTESDHLARLALAVAQNLDARDYPEGLIVDQQAESWALLAMVRLAREELMAARLALTTAECLVPGGSGDPLTQAAVSTTRAHLLAKERNFPGSIEVLNEIAELYTVVDDPALLGMTLIQRGLVHQQLEDAEQARRDLNAGLFLIDGNRYPEVRELCSTALENLPVHLSMMTVDQVSNLAH